MRQHTSVTDLHLIILRPPHAKLKEFTLLSLEGNVVGMGMMVLMVMGSSSLIYDHRRYRQHRRILVLDELSDVLYKEVDEEKQPNNNEYLHFSFSYNL